MAKTSLRTSRDQLAKFIPDHETIRQFENLFIVAEEVNNTSVQDALIESGIAISKANEALARASSSLIESFEVVNRNIKSHDKTFSYTGSRLDFITYTNGSNVIVKSLSYSGNKLSSVTLSGDTPSGIDLIKTLSYSGNYLNGVSYS